MKARPLRGCRHHSANVASPVPSRRPEGHIRRKRDDKDSEEAGLGSQQHPREASGREAGEDAGSEPGEDAACVRQGDGEGQDRGPGRPFEGDPPPAATARAQAVRVGAGERRGRLSLRAVPRRQAGARSADEDPGLRAPGANGGTPAAPRPSRRATTAGTSGRCARAARPPSRSCRRASPFRSSSGSLGQGRADSSRSRSVPMDRFDGTDRQIGRRRTSHGSARSSRSSTRSLRGVSGTGSRGSSRAIAHRFRSCGCRPSPPATATRRRIRQRHSVLDQRGRALGGLRLR